MTPSELAYLARFYTRTNSTTFPDAEILALLKVRREEITTKLVTDLDEDLFVVTYTENLVLNQRQYPFQNDYLKLKKIEAKLDGTNWLVLKEMDIGVFDLPTDETGITTQFANLQDECGYDIVHNGIYIYSGTITGVTSGLKTKYAKEPVVITDLSSSTDMGDAVTNTTHGLPKAVHELLARGISIDYKNSREKPIPLNEREQKYEFDLQRAVNSLKKGNLDREILGAEPTSSSVGNDGADWS